MADAVIDTPALTRWLTEFARLVAEHRDELTALDAAIGDADHGTNMDRGMSAVLAALPGTDAEPPAALLKKVASTLISTVGGASGPLYGTFFLRMATAASGPALDPPGFAAALRAGVGGVVARGKAELGDKTMYDALAPAVDALDAALGAGKPLDEALAEAARAAAEGRDGTIPLVARKGRASYLGERSAGHQDPGATSSALLLAATHALVASGNGG